jgi:hypothetical protein
MNKLKQKSIKDTSNKYKKRLINILCGIIGFISAVFLKISGFWFYIYKGIARADGDLILYVLNPAGRYNMNEVLEHAYYLEDKYQHYLDIMIMVLVFWLLRKIIYYFIGNIKHTRVYEDGSKYVGTTIPFTEIRNGSGLVQWTNGDKYYGDFKDNFRTGDGVFHYADGNRYVGKFYKNEFNGFGTFYFADEGKVSGMYENGKLIDEYER